MCFSHVFRLWLLSISIATISCAIHTKCWAVRENHPWDKRTWEDLDAQVPGYFVNLGPTGGRAILHELDFEVTYIEPGSPAEGVLKLGDRICGANGKRFLVKHRFGWSSDRTGGEGPLMDMGNAILASEGNPSLAGRLSLTIRRDNRDAMVNLQLEQLGAWSDTYPYNCQRSDLILDQICSWLARRQRNDGSWPGHDVVTSVSGLVLLASGDPTYSGHVKRAVEHQTKLRAYQRGLHNWRLTYGSIFLSEYYLAKRNGPRRQHEVLDALRELDAGLLRNIDRNGFTKHMKIGDPDGFDNNYPELSIMSGLALVSLGLMKDSGLEIAPERIDSCQNYIRSATRPNGYVCYSRRERLAVKDEKAGDWGNTGGDWGRGGTAILGFLQTGTPANEFTPIVEFIRERPKLFTETHGSAGVGMQWSAIALSRADPTTFRQVMDDHRWYFALARTHDGSFVAQPNRSGAVDYWLLPRDWMTATIGLILSIKEQRLHVMRANGED